MLLSDDPLGRSEHSDTVVVKLGGSIITDKRSPFTYRGERVLRLAREMVRSEIGLVLIHGGGSFGHPVARKYGLSSRTSSPSAVGIARTREVMYRLDQLFCSSLTEAGLHPYPFSPFDLLAKAGGQSGRSWIESLIKAGLVPVTFGDVVQGGRGFRILSGDTIAYELCRLLAPLRCIFVLDVEGVYDKKGEVIPEIGDTIKTLKLARVDDSTGGIRLKLNEARRIAALGVQTIFVSGNRPRDFAKSLRGLRFHGTIVKGRS